MGFSKWMLAVAVASLPISAVANSLERARAERETFEKASELWTLKLRAAKTPEEQRKIWEDQPSASAHADRLWSMIQSSLAEEWTLEPAAWFIRTAPDRREEVEAIRTALESHHLESPEIAALCYSLTAVPDPRSLSLLEKVVRESPHPTARGAASLGVSMLLKGLGDEPEIMRRRLELLRQAIIDSANVDLGGTTVAEVAEDELFIISNLVKGRVPPEIEGLDASGNPLKLSESRGKVVVLLFWATWNEGAAKTLDLTREFVERMQGKNVEVIGVNADHPATLRALRAEGAVTWRNVSDPEREIAKSYRISEWPIAYVLDPEGRIQFIGAPGSFVELAAEALLEE